jgi:hypothetical protein
MVMPIDLRRSCSKALTSALLLSVLGRPATSWAGAPEIAAAEALFDQGKKLMASHRYVEACPAFEESQRLDAALGTLLNLADCREKEGHSAAAWSRFLEAAAMAQAAGHRDAERVARDRAAALARRLPKVVIDVKANAAGLEIKRDGVLVAAAQWGTPIPVDPGPTRLTASAPDRRTWETTIVGGAEGTTASIAIPELEQAGDPSQAPAPVVAAAAAGSPPNRSETPPAMSTTRRLAIVSGGVGVAGLLVGTIFGLQSIARHDEAGAHCDGPSCRDAEGLSLKADARRAGNVSTVAFAVGALGLAGGALLWLTPGSPSATQLGLGPATIGVRGQW